MSPSISEAHTPISIPIGILLVSYFIVIVLVISLVGCCITGHNSSKKGNAYLSYIHIILVIVMLIQSLTIS